MIYAIGDIHGCLHALETIWNALKISTTDQVILLGDYIDRGPDSPGVIDWIIEKRELYPIIALKGNHDIYMLRSHNDPALFKKWMRFGGDITLKSYQINDYEKWYEQVPNKHFEFLEDTLPYYETEHFIFVHAGLDPGIELSAQNEKALFWNKYYIPQKYAENKTVICGHTSRKNGEISDFKHTICLDTYAYGGKWLTCLNLSTGFYYQSNQQGIIQRRHLRSVI